MPDWKDLIENLNFFVNGAVMFAFLVAGLFFLRFWRKTRDRLFVLFAASFIVLGINRLGLSMTQTENEARNVFYLIRLIAFVLILYAIIDKNRAAKRRVG
jgi:drug/metabolite transporter (DMT)-like permease